MPINDDYEQYRHQKHVERQNERLIELEKERLGELKRMRADMDRKAFVESIDVGSGDGGGRLGFIGVVLYLALGIFLYIKTDFFTSFGNRFGPVTSWLLIIGGAVVVGVIGLVVEVALDKD